MTFITAYSCYLLIAFIIGPIAYGFLHRLNPDPYYTPSYTAITGVSLIWPGVILMIIIVCLCRLINVFFEMNFLKSFVQFMYDLGKGK